MALYVRDAAGLVVADDGVPPPLLETPSPAEVLGERDPDVVGPRTRAAPGGDLRPERRLRWPRTPAGVLASVGAPPEQVLRARSFLAEAERISGMRRHRRAELARPSAIQGQASCGTSVVSR